MHTLQIVLDNSNKTLSVLLDEKQVLTNISLPSMYRSSPAVSFVVRESAEVTIDDVTVKIAEPWKKYQKWNVLLTESFERFIDIEQLKDSGWIQLKSPIDEKIVESSGETGYIIEQDSDNTGQSLKLQSAERKRLYS
jgi:hypothetical protein